MTTPADTAHADLHSEFGAHPGDPHDRAAQPVIKIVDIAWLEFEKQNIAQAERFAHDFGFTTVSRTADELSLRGTWAGAPCLLIRRSHRSRFVGPAFRAAGHDDLLRLSRETGRRVYPLGDLGGSAVDLTDPSGMSVRVVAGITDLPSLPDQHPLTLNFGGKVERVNAIQRPPREPARVQRLGHVVIETPRFRENLAWYQEMLGMIVSDFLFFPGQRERGPAMAFIRCDRGAEPADHHTLAMTLGPMSRYVHSAYQVADLDAVAAGSAYLTDRGYHHAWGIGRHIQGSQLFDYWRDLDKFMVEHFADGDMFDSSVEAGWAPFTASGLAQWGPPVTRDFLGVHPDPQLLAGFLAGLRNDNEFDIHRLLGLLKVARDIQLPKTQFYESKSYPTFTPVGPALVLLSHEEWRRFDQLRLQLWVNGERRQNGRVGGDMIIDPVGALSVLTGFQRLDAGDLLLTGTPGGTALSAPPKPIEIIGSLIPPHVKWKQFFKRQASNPKYLADGDVVEVRIATDDGVIELGRQRCQVRYA